MGARRRLARQGFGLAEHRDHGIGRARRLDRGREALGGLAAQAAAIGMNDGDAGSLGALPDAVENRHRVLAMPARRVRPKVILGARRERADDRDGPHAGRERQDIAAVLQQHEGFARDRPRRLTRLRRREHGVDAARVDVRPLEQVEAELDAQHAPDRLVDGCLRHAPGPHLVGEMKVVEPAGEVHVDAGEEGLAGGLGAVGRDAVGDELVDRRPVRHHEAGKAPLIAQDAGEEPRVRRRRHAVQRVEGAHDGVGSGLDRGTERRQEDIAELGRRDVGRVVVAPAGGGAVAGEMLDPGREPAGVQPLDARRREHAGEIRVLAGALDDAAPARIARDVGHRRVGPLHADIGGLAGRRFRRHPGERRVEGRGLGERHREDGAEAVQHVEAEDQRDAEPRLPRQPLRGGDVLGVVEIDPGADAALAHHLGPVERTVRDEIELADLLGERHAGKELLDLAVDLAGRQCSRRKRERKRRRGRNEERRERRPEPRGRSVSVEHRASWKIDDNVGGRGLVASRPRLSLRLALMDARD